jgi:hypothetical protein
MEGKKGGSMASGLILLAIGVVGLFLVYSHRPPRGFMEAMGMMMEGRQKYLKSPLYEIGLGVFGILSVFGAFRSFKAASKGTPPVSPA